LHLITNILESVQGAVYIYIDTAPCTNTWKKHYAKKKKSTSFFSFQVILSIKLLPFVPPCTNTWKKHYAKKKNRPHFFSFQVILTKKKIDLPFHLALIHEKTLCKKK